MAYIANQKDARSMKKIITLTDGYATIENGNITTPGDITTSNITKNVVQI